MSLFRGERVYIEVVGADVRFCRCGVEQRKTALRRVEMELDEADEMVRASPTYQYLFPNHKHFPRSPKWKSNSKASPNP